MKWITIFLLVGALGATGCLTPPLPVETDLAAKKPVVVTPTPPAPPPAPPPVLPDQVTEVNAVQKAQELARELDHAAAEPLPALTPQAAQPETTVRP